MVIQILGTGCPKCRALEAHARQAAEAGGMNAAIEKITELDAIMDMGVMLTPALAVDGVVKSAGKVLSRDQILTILKEAR